MGKYKMTPEHLAKAVAASKAAWTDERRRKIGDGNRGKVRTPEMRARYSAALLGVPYSEERRKRRGEEARRRVATPEGLARMREVSALGHAALAVLYRDNADYRARQAELCYRMSYAARPPVVYVDRLGREWRLRSGWEEALAKRLDVLQVDWVHEAYRLVLSTGQIYLPDFWVATWNTLIEVKGGRRGAKGDPSKALQAQRDGYPLLLLSTLKAIKNLTAPLPITGPRRPARRRLPPPRVGGATIPAAAL